MPQVKLPDQYANLTLAEALVLYDGPGSLEPPPELVEFVDAARKWREVRRLQVGNDRRLFPGKGTL